MRSPLDRHVAWLTLVFVACATAGPLAAAESTLSREDAATLRKLMYDYRKPGIDAATRGQLIGQIRALGPAAIEQMSEVLDKTLGSPIQGYQLQLFRAVQRSAIEKRRTADAATVEKLRHDVLDLRDNANLSKEQIVATGDPALDKLGGLLMPNVTDAIAGDERLKQTRDRIVEQAADWAALTGRPVDDVLAPAERTATLMALAPDGVSQNTLAGNLRYASRLDAEVVAGIDELNRIRLLLGLGAQAIDPKLCAAATDHSTDMAEKGFFAHESPVPGKASPWDRAKRFGTSASAENIAAGMSTGVAAIHGWWHSPGHFKNMLGGHKRVGLGEHDKHWTQMFG